MSYLKLIGAGIGAALLIGLFLVVNGWRKDAAELPLVQAALDQQKANMAEEHRLLSQSQEASSGFQAELKRLNDAAIAAALQPARPVRLCRLPVAPRPGADPAAQPGPDEASAAGGGVPEGVGPDIGPDLKGFALKADTLSAQIRGLHDYINNVCLSEPQ